MEFSVKEVINLVFKRIIWIIIGLFVGVSASFVCSKYIINPSYTASVQLYVIPNDTEASVSLNELNYAQKVVTTYINFLNTNVFYEKILDDTKIDYSINQLKAMTSVKSINNTEIFQISVTSYSAETSYSLAESMERIAPELIKSIKPSAEISVVDPVKFPNRPSGPDIIKNTIIGGMLGLTASVFIILLVEILDTNIKNKEDLIAKYQLPVLGEIPNFNLSKDDRKTKKRPFISKKKKRLNIKSSVNDHSKFLFNEAFKALRTNLRFALIKEGCKKIIISSPLPSEGKSTTSINLGIAISQTGSRVLIIDCDLRKGKIHNSFNLKYKPGLTDALSGMVELKDVTKKTSYENLDIIPLGTLSPNPSELLSSSQMEKILLLLEKDYNYILFDTPPVNVLSDSLSLAKYSDGILLVVREGKTSHPILTNALDKFKLSQGNILGFVLNGISMNKGKKLNYYYSYYGGNHD
ncbi:MAG: polysaccharide biosynthesis tyrosine autokinase [Clostridiales bacterium]|nr:polysaccharide biosynthesis tyrosine autokinase [Clostridiales bacterium]